VPLAPSAAAIPEADIAPSGTLAEAWSRWLDGGHRVPRGLVAFLRSATVREVEGTLEIAPPPGPAVDRLDEAPVQEDIRAGLAPYLGRSLRIRVVPQGHSAGPAGQARRIGRAEVRADTLKALFRKEPRLERAVEELDLELME
jgi:hypothetical protein